MRVIKLGGSLAGTEYLIDCLNVLEHYHQGGSLVVVPGGGVFADQVRTAQQKWHFDDQTAHYMALLAMQQMALLFKGLKPDLMIAHGVGAIKALLNQQQIIIWSPDIVELDNANLSASWDITSDSLSAWLANELSATELVLIKAAVIEGNPSLHQLFEQQVVDKAFCEFVKKSTVITSVVNVQDWLFSIQKTY